MAAYRPLALALALALALVTAASPSSEPLRPSAAAVRRNGVAIFNAVHSAFRQWGSSVNHNGLSFFLATVPEGQLLYHGGPEPGRPAGLTGEGFDWAAFEPEHAQLFTRPWWSCRHLGEGGGEGEGEVGLLAARNVCNTEKQNAALQQGLSAPYGRGYFHTYRAARPLRLLYIDGMGAAKSDYGTLDTQDYLLLDWPLNHSAHGDLMWAELRRAAALCRLADNWDRDTGHGRIDGFVRLEAGFEIIYCDFGPGAGLDLVSIEAAPVAGQDAPFPGLSVPEYLRAVATRYQGFPSGRLAIDWSSMVSAFFYDVNLTNPDAARPELPRLLGTTRHERHAIRQHLVDVIAARQGSTAAIDWQGIVDMVVTRYAPRIQLLGQDKSPAYLQTAAQILSVLLYPFMDFRQEGPQRQADAGDRCTVHYLEPALAYNSSWTAEDGYIYMGIETVTRTICDALLEMHNVLQRSEPDGSDGIESTADRLRVLANRLAGTLQWTTDRACDPCARLGEICFIAMFPWGDESDHFAPRCQRPDQFVERYGYWLKGLIMPRDGRVRVGVGEASADRSKDVYGQ